MMDRLGHLLAQVRGRALKRELVRQMGSIGRCRSGVTQSDDIPHD